MSNLTSEMQDITYSALSFFVGLLYYSILHSSEKQATFGKQVCKIKIVSESGMVSFACCGQGYTANYLYPWRRSDPRPTFCPNFCDERKLSAMQGGAITLMVLLVIGLLIGPISRFLCEMTEKSLRSNL